MKSLSLSITALAAVAVAAPMKRQALSGDVAILNYALTLEHLEDTFYRQGLAKFSAADFKAAGFHGDTYDKVSRIAYDEKTHVAFITSALGSAGAPAVAECQYNFGSAYDNPANFLATASVLEGVGVSAYLGAAADIMSKTYLTAAGSILTVEARHSAYIRNKIKESPFPQPFDDPLSENSVYTLAAPFITSCPQSNPQLPLKAFPSLAVQCADNPIKVGSVLTLSPGSGFNSNGGSVYAAFITVTGPIAVQVQSGYQNTYQVTVPSGIAGQSYVVLTSSMTDASDNSILAGPAIVEVSS